MGHFRTTLALVWGAGFLFAVAAVPAKPDTILVGAPNVGSTEFAMNTFDAAAEFTLSAPEYVTTVDVVLLGGGGLYDFALQNALTGSIKIFSSAVFTVPTSGQNTEVMTVDQTLAAGTYFLVGGKDPADTFPGWWLSDGTYVTYAGTVADGIWFTSPNAPWSFSGANDATSAPAFAVNGSTVVPESSTPLLAAMGMVGLAGMAGGRRRFRQSEWRARKLTTSPAQTYRRWPFSYFQLK